MCLGRDEIGHQLTWNAISRSTSSMSSGASEWKFAAPEVRILNVHVPGEPFTMATVPDVTFGWVTPATGLRVTGAAGRGACGCTTKLPACVAVASTVSPVTVIVFPRAQRGNWLGATLSVNTWWPPPPGPARNRHQLSAPESA